MNNFVPQNSTSYYLIIRLLVFCVLSLSYAASNVLAAEFIPLGKFSIDWARGVSSTGVVVGQTSNDQAYLWSEETGTVGLGNLPGHSFTSVNAISEDGSTVVGTSTTTIDAMPYENLNFIYTMDGGMQPMGHLPFQVVGHDSVNAISSDGAVAVGSETDFSGPENVVHAVRWTDAEGAVSLGPPSEGDQRAEALDVSADGSVIVGKSWAGDLVDELFIWTEATGMVGLGIPIAARGLRVSGDGAAVAGAGLVTSEEFYEAFVWIEEDSAVGLGWLPGTQQSDGTFFSTVRGINADGSLIVGYSGANRFSDEPVSGFIWTADQGMRGLQQVLIDDYGLGDSLIGWTKLIPQDMSDNGQFVVGLGLNPDGASESWFLRLDTPIPEPSTGLLALAGSALLVLRIGRQRG